MWSYVHGRYCIYNRRSRDIFYLIYWIGECDVRRHWSLFVTITPLLQSMEGTCHRLVCIVVLAVHLVHNEPYVLLYMLLHVYVLWCLLRTWCCQCLLHLSYVLAICMCCGAWSALMCWLYVCVVVLGAHLCVGYIWCLERTYVLAICGAWSAPMCWLYVVLGAHLCVGYMW